MNFLTAGIYLIKKIALFFLILLTIIIIFNCKNKPKNNDISEFINSINLLKLGTLSDKKNVFDFNMFSIENEWLWYKSQELIRVDSSFYEKFLRKSDMFNYWKDYQTYYFWGLIKLDDELFTIIIFQRIHNDDEANMYLVTFNNEGDILNIFTLAKIEKSPDDFIKIRSYIMKKRIEMTKIYISQNGETAYKDSVTSRYIINSGNDIKKINVDSIRNKL